MYGQMSPELPNRLYAELVRIGDQERLARRIIRERKAARRTTRREDRPVITIGAVAASR